LVHAPLRWERLDTHARPTTTRSATRSTTDVQCPGLLHGRADKGHKTRRARSERTRLFRGVAARADAVTPTPWRSPCDDLERLSGNGSPPFRIRVSGGGDRAVVAVAGELDIAAADRLAQAFDLADRGGATRVVVDAGELEFIDFTGVEVLVNARRRAELRGGSLVVTGANADIAEVLTFTGQRRLMGDAVSSPIQPCDNALRSFSLDGILEGRTVAARWHGNALECDDRLRRQLQLVRQIDALFQPSMDGSDPSEAAVPAALLVALIRACDRVLRMEVVFAP